MHRIPGELTPIDDVAMLHNASRLCPGGRMKAAGPTSHELRAEGRSHKRPRPRPGI